MPPPLSITQSNPHYQDVYARGGLEEKCYTFLDLQNLPARLAALGPKDSFTIAELGFGLGLTFLALARLLATLPTPPHVTVHSYELHPHPWPTLLTLWHTLVPHLTPAFASAFTNPAHPIHIPSLNLTLHLHVGDATQTLAKTAPFQADAWFLDGHTPAKNPALWHPALLQEVARRTHPGGTASTYSVAKSVKQGLVAAGFSIQKHKGFPPKREALVAKKSD